MRTVLRQVFLPYRYPWSLGGLFGDGFAWGLPIGLASLDLVFGSDLQGSAPHWARLAADAILSFLLIKLIVLICHVHPKPRTPINLNNAHQKAISGFAKGLGGMMALALILCLSGAQPQFQGHLRWLGALAFAGWTWLLLQVFANVVFRVLLRHAPTDEKMRVLLTRPRGTNGPD
jgi:hypothetical protein